MGCRGQGQDVKNNDALCMCRAPSQTHSSKSKHSLLQDLWDKDDCRSFTGGETEVQETSELTEDSSMSRHQIRTRVKMQRCESLEIMMYIGDARQQCCHSHHYASSQDLLSIYQVSPVLPGSRRQACGKGGYQDK